MSSQQCPSQFVTHTQDMDSVPVICTTHSNQAKGVQLLGNTGTRSWALWGTAQAV